MRVILYAMKTKQTLTIRDVTLSLTTSGTGRPFIWGHGLTSSQAEEDDLGLFAWQNVTEVAQLIRYDARGHGQSTASYQVTDYRWSQLAQDLLGVADAQGIDRFVAGGASMGSAAALFAALREPTRIDRLILAIPPTAWEKRRAQAEIYELFAQVTEQQGLSGLVEFFRQQPRVGFLHTEYPERREISLRHTAQMNETALPYIFRGAGVSDLPTPATLRQINQPTLILAWAEDSGHPISTAEQLAELLPHSTLHVAHRLADIHQWPTLVYDFLKNDGHASA